MHTSRRRAPPSAGAPRIRGPGRRFPPLVLLLAALAAAPAIPAAQAQWREGAAANPAVAADTRAGRIAGYAQMVDTWGDRLTQAVREVQALAPTGTQDGAMSVPRTRLLDVAQTAWMVIREVPEGFDGNPAYQEATEQFRSSLAAMRVASTPTPEALAEARRILAALERLEAAAAEAARTAATAGR